MRLLIVVNPKAAKGKTLKKFPRLESLLNASGVEYDVQWTEGPGHATAIAEEKRDKFDVVVAFGGDGTVNELINGLVGSDTPLGVLPSGNGNDFARSCRIPLSIEKALKTVFRNEAKKIDLGLTRNQFFGNAVGVGFDAFTSKESRKIKRLRGTLMYIWAVLKSLSKYEALPMRIELDDDTIEESTYLVAIGNGWSIGGGLQLTPDAVLDDGEFHVCHVGDISSMKVVRNFLKLINGKINDVEEVSMYTSRHVKITSEVPLPIHIDGEIPEEDIKEIEIELAPESVYVLGNWKSNTHGDDVE